MIIFATWSLAVIFGTGYVVFFLNHSPYWWGPCVFLIILFRLLLTIDDQEPESVKMNKDNSGDGIQKVAPPAVVVSSAAG